MHFDLSDPSIFGEHPELPDEALGGILIIWNGNLSKILICVSSVVILCQCMGWIVIRFERVLC